MKNKLPLILLALLFLMFFMNLTYAYGADSEKYAILVGVANYQNIRPLKYTINDVYSMKNLLTEQNFTTYTLIDSNATKENIKSTIYNVSSMVKENDTFIFYFSGHGTNGPDLPYYICPYDAKNLSTCIRADELATWIKTINCKNKILIFDTCFSGGLAIEKENVKTTVLSYVTSNTTENVTIGYVFGNETTVITSCSEDEFSYEDYVLNHGVFTYYFLKAFKDPRADIDKDGFISLLEAFNYTLSRVRKYVENRFWDEQTPKVYGIVANIKFRLLLPDLTVVSAACEVLSPSVLRVSYIVKNIGYGFALAPWQDVIYLSATKVLEEFYTIAARNDIQKDLLANATYNITTYIYFSSQNLYLIIHCDELNYVPELNKTNNYFVAPISTLIPSSSKLNEKNFSITIKNVGSEPILFKYYVSVYTSPVKGSRILYDEYFYFLTPGEKIIIDLGSFPANYAVSTTFEIINPSSSPLHANMQAVFNVEGYVPQILVLSKYIPARSKKYYTIRFTTNNNFVDIW